MPRSAAAEEGIALLKRGSRVHKHNRSGKSALTVFTLSADVPVVLPDGATQDGRTLQVRSRPFQRQSPPASTLPCTPVTRPCE